MALGSSPVDYEYRGLEVRFYPRGNTAEKRALLNPARFDPVELAFLEESLSQGDTFLDIGANAGLYGLYAAKVLGPEGLVLAFEPNPDVLPRLTFNVALNAKDKRPDLAEIRVIEKAVTAANGPVHFALPTKNLGEGHVLEAGQTADETLTVEGVTLKDCLQSQGIKEVDALKIDIEGHELSALAPFLENAPKSLYPGAIVIERGEPSHWQPLEDLLRASGYRQHLSTSMNEIWLKGSNQS